MRLNVLKNFSGSQDTPLVVWRVLSWNTVRVGHVPDKLVRFHWKSVKCATKNRLEYRLLYAPTPPEG